MMYRQSVTQIPSLPGTELGSFDSIESHSFIPIAHIAYGPSQLKQERVDDDDEEMGLFRRVCIKTSIVLPAADWRPGSPLLLWTTQSSDISDVDLQNDSVKEMLDLESTNKRIGNPATAETDVTNASSDFVKKLRKDLTNFVG
jgi:hypothetical protein